MLLFSTQKLFQLKIIPPSISITLWHLASSVLLLYHSLTLTPHGSLTINSTGIFARWPPTHALLRCRHGQALYRYGMYQYLCNGK